MRITLTVLQTAVVLMGTNAIDETNTTDPTGQTTEPTMEPTTEPTMDLFEFSTTDFLMSTDVEEEEWEPGELEMILGTAVVGTLLCCACFLLIWYLHKWCTEKSDHTDSSSTPLHSDPNPGGGGGGGGTGGSRHSASGIQLPTFQVSEEDHKVMVAEAEGSISIGLRS